MKSLMLLMLMLMLSTVVLAWGEKANQESGSWMDNSDASRFTTYQKDAKQTLTGAIETGRYKPDAAFEETKDKASEQAIKAMNEAKAKMGDVKGNFDSAKEKAAQAAANVGKNM